MKKVLAVILALVMAFSVSAVAFAQGNGGFVSSPSNNEAPEVEDVEYEDGSCEPEIIVTPYKDREVLDEIREKALIAAYNEIAANKDLSKMCTGLIAVAAKLGVSVLRFAISDLFDVSAYHNGDHEYCGTITITLSSETIKNFVALLHRNANGDWNVVEDVIVNKAENSITFATDDFSPFAIVVDTHEESINTGSDIVVPAVVMFISAVSLAVVLVTLKKKQRA